MEKCGTDLEQITETIQNYFDGMHHRDLERLRKAFHPEAYLFGYLHEKPVHISAEDWFKMVEAAPADAESGATYDMRIISTDVSGSVATVKAANVYQGVRFTDHLALLKADDHWVITNKSFFS